MSIEFYKNELPDIFRVESIVTFHYFEYTKDFHFIGEKHDFWELVYVDNGSVSITADAVCHVLGKGDIVFHEPNEFHSIWANGIYSNVIVLTFDCNSLEMNYFIKKIIKSDEVTGKIFAEILKLQLATFNEPLNIVEQKKMTLKSDAPIGNLQLIKINIERLLIHLRQLSDNYEVKDSPPYNQILEDSDNSISAIIAYMLENLQENITLDMLSEKTAYSKSYIKKNFKAATGMTVIECLTKMRIDHARYLISLKKYNFSEIADMSGFKSIHYFSKVFKKYTLMTPTEYEKSVIAYSVL